MKTESEQQITFIQWCKRNAINYPELDNIFAIPNGGLRAINTASRLKLEGAKPGVPDLFLAVSKRGFHGLFIEMKRSNKQKLSKDQQTWFKKLSNQKYATLRANNSEEAIKIIKSYLKI